MKLGYAAIENFKGIRKLEIDFGDPARSSPLHALLGDNGSGKTSVLQAIALALSLATRRTYPLPEDFRWNGFLPERLGTLGSTRVNLTILFEDDEIAACHEAFNLWRNARSMNGGSRSFIEPSADRTLDLVLEHGGKLHCSQGLAGLYQFCGRYYVKGVLKFNPDARTLFSRLGDVFWYDQYRNLGGVATEGSDERQDPQMDESWTTGIQQLRRFMLGWWAYHASPKRGTGKDYISELQRLFGLIFPGTLFVGVEPMPANRGISESEFYFLLQRGDRIFDMAEMSSGEQAIFPLMCDFVRLGIHRSIVLIDELELHLHPPEQQALLSSVYTLGPECQFIISTHSAFIEGSLLPDQITRLPGGRLCL